MAAKYKKKHCQNSLPLLYRGPIGQQRSAVAVDLSNGRLGAHGRSAPIRVSAIHRP